MDGSDSFKLRFAQHSENKSDIFNGVNGYKPQNLGLNLLPVFHSSGYWEHPSFLLHLRVHVIFLQWRGFLRCVYRFKTIYLHWPRPRPPLLPRPVTTRFHCLETRVLVFTCSIPNYPLFSILQCLLLRRRRLPLLRWGFLVVSNSLKMILLFVNSKLYTIASIHHRVTVPVQ